jgi:nucleotide-binding universal stress UspA family protein
VLQIFNDLKKIEVLAMSIKRILVSVDGSLKSMSAVDYVGKIMSKQNIHVTLFHVLMQRPEAYLDFNVISAREDSSMLEEWLKKSGKYIDKFMSHAVNKLIQSGFSPNSVEVVSQDLETGYARDILKKAADNFDAIVVGRYGFSNLGNYVLGSITSKLAESIHKIPLIVVGAEVDAKKILIAFDCSANSKKAVDYVGDFADKKDCHVLLLTIVRPVNISVLKHERFFTEKYEQDWLDANTKKIALVMAEMKKRLVACGFSPDLISETILREKQSRAECIFSHARNQGFGTIVAGRKGLTDISEFVMGRVTRKILFMGSDKAVWIV